MAYFTSHEITRCRPDHSCQHLMEEINKQLKKVKPNKQLLCPCNDTIYPKYTTVIIILSFEKLLQYVTIFTDQIKCTREAKIIPYCSMRNLNQNEIQISNP